MINDARFNEVVHSLLVELMSDQAEDINLQLSALRILEQGLMSRLKTLSADHNAYEIINLTVPNWQYVLKTFFYVFLVNVTTFFASRIISQLVQNYVKRQQQNRNMNIRVKFSSSALRF